MNRLVVLGIAFALVGGVGLPGESRGADGTLHKVVIERDTLMFEPQALSIRRGDRIQWTNRDQQMHMVVTAKPGSEGRELELYKRIDPGESFEHEFTTEAAYYYYCAIHFQMWGIISVNP